MKHITCALVMMLALVASAADKTGGKTATKKAAATTAKKVEATKEITISGKIEKQMVKSTKAGKTTEYARFYLVNKDGKKISISKKLATKANKINLDALVGKTVDAKVKAVVAPKKLPKIKQLISMTVKPVGQTTAKDKPPVAAPKK